jgi:MFS family permease
VLITLVSGQFLMTLDSSVMNVAIATVAKDVGTTVTGIQTAITLYTLVMAMLMIVGGKVGSLIGRRRAAVGIPRFFPSIGTALAGDPGGPGREPASPPGRTAHRARGPRASRAPRPVLHLPDPHRAARIWREVLSAGG